VTSEFTEAVSPSTSMRAHVRPSSKSAKGCVEPVDAAPRVDPGAGSDADGNSDAERLQSLLDLTVDFFWEQDEFGQFTMLRPSDSVSADIALEQRLMELSLDSDLDTAADLEGWQRYRSALATRRSFRNLLCRLTDAQGRARSLSISGRPFLNGQGEFRGYRGIIREVGGQLRSEQLLYLENTIAHALAKSNELTEGIRAVVQAICESERWVAGRFWIIDSRDAPLRNFAAWPDEVDPVASRRAPAPDARWAAGAPLWVSGRGMLIPVHLGSELHGVFEFDAPELAEPDPPLECVLRIVATATGHFFGRALAVERLRESEQRFAATMEWAAIGIAHVDDDGRLLYVNPQLCKMLQYTEKELTGMSIKAISHPEDTNTTDEMRAALRAGAIESFKIEKRYLRKDGTSIWVGLTIATERDRAGRRIADVSVIEDISVRKRAEERVRYVATHDGLTGLPNRAMFSELLNHALESAKRRGTQVAVLFIDLDRFKIINDSLGHDAGDVLLREISARLRQCLRASDVVARLGGDEFVVLLQDIGAQDQAAKVARNIGSATFRPVLIEGQECRVTASIGICMHPMAGQDDRSVLKHADMAMYMAKEEGKNKFQFYSPSIQAQNAGRLTLETNLRRALERNELALHYQAKLSLSTGAITGVEALLRWRNPELGAVAPANFIPVAEETGMILPIGRWVLRTACTQNVAWQKLGLPRVRVCVNLSLRQLEDPYLVSEIEAVLRETGMDPDLLELEVTESMIMQDTERSVRVLKAIKALGVRLAIDDFGTGYSSLAHLKRFPIDTLKLDRSFIREIVRDAEDRAIAQAIITMGKTLNLTIVGEGVETQEQQTFLCQQDCDEMQGFYFSTPVEPAEFATLLEQHRPQRCC
jgi:diguanylate cyclase (GGDEF)-like protein/PAS domain S-box-containing protein